MPFMIITSLETVPTWSIGVLIIAAALACWKTLQLILINRSIKQYLKNPSAKKKKIAVMLTSMSSYGIRTALQTFLTSTTKYAPFQIDIFQCNCQGDLNNVAYWMQYIIEHKVQLLCCLGQAVSARTIEYMKSHNISLPLVIAGLTKEFIEENKEEIEEAKGSLSLTGNYSSFHWEEKIDIITSLLPSLKKVLIINRSFDEITRASMHEKNTFSSLLRRKKIEAIMHHVPETGLSTHLTEETFKGVDAVIISKLYTFHIGSNLSTHKSPLPLIMKICTKLNIPVFVPESMNAGMKGHVMLSAEIENMIADDAARKVLTILEKNLTPVSLPFSAIYGTKQKIGIDLAEANKINFLPELIKNQISLSSLICIKL